MKKKIVLVLVIMVMLMITTTSALTAKLLFASNFGNGVVLKPPSPSRAPTPKLVFLGPSP